MASLRAPARRRANRQLEVTQGQCVDVLSNGELSGDSTEESMATNAILLATLESSPQRAEAEAAAEAETSSAIALVNELEGATASPLEGATKRWMVAQPRSQRRLWQ